MKDQESALRKEVKAHASTQKERDKLQAQVADLTRQANAAAAEAAASAKDQVMA